MNQHDYRHLTGGARTLVLGVWSVLHCLCVCVCVCVCVYVCVL